jgi:ketosteroid isomerase-like protein
VSASFGALTGVPTLGTLAVSPEETAMSRSDIDALNETFSRGIREGDAALMASVYAPDARLLPPNSDALTGPAIETFWKEMVSAGVSAGTLTTRSLEELGDTAIEEGQYQIEVGGSVVDTGKYVVVHRRQPDGSWKFGVDIWNSSRPATDPTAQ